MALLTDAPRERSDRPAVTVSGVARFLGLWLLAGFSLGTSTLLGPVQRVAAFVRERDLSAETEDRLVLGLIAILVVGSGALAAALARAAGPGAPRSTRVGAWLLPAIATAAALWVWMTPSLLGIQMGEEKSLGTRFLFGPYPDESKLRALRAEGYQGVVSLLHPAVVPFEPKLIADEKKAARAAGIELVHVPMLPWIGDNEKSLARVRELATAHTGRYYVHCYLGKDRVSMVRRVLTEAGADVAAAPSEPERALEGKESLERGPIHVLGDVGYLTPYPTDDELVRYVLGGGIASVASLLDPENPKDLAWIEKERALFSQHSLPFELLPVPGGAGREDAARRAAARVQELPQPVLVHAFLSPDGGRSPSAQAFLDAFRSAAPQPPAEVVTVPSGETALPERGLGRLMAAIPTPRTAVVWGPYLLVFAGLAGAFAGRLRTRHGVRTPYTRKIFHLAIFSAAALVHILGGLTAVLLLGGIVALIVLHAVWRGEGYPLYEAMARETDAPHRTLFILVPLLTTALGGILANVFFGAFAQVGYLVGGWGDAVGEPIGTRWGRHRYRVPSLAGVPATRSLEGSFGVMLFGAAAATIALLASGVPLPTALKIGAACGAGGAAVEAVSTHGLDNLTIQLAAAGLAFFLLAG